MNEDQRRTEEVRLLAAIKNALPSLEQLWQQANSHWELDEPPNPLPSGWAAVLYLYGLR